MLEFNNFGVFLTAAILLAITPGPGIFYVLTRSINGGRTEGVVSTAGTTVGGLFHVVAAGLGISAILATSALAFSVVKYAGAAYLVFLGLRALLRQSHVDTPGESANTGNRSVFKEGVITEALNPKTALFFLAFIPQFVNPNGFVFAQFVILGCISVLLNSSADLVVAFTAGPLSYRFLSTPKLQQGQRYVSGLSFVALGMYIAAKESN